jgi:hypothetical protein
MDINQTFVFKCDSEYNVSFYRVKKDGKSSEELIETSDRTKIDGNTFTITQAGKKNIFAENFQNNSNLSYTGFFQVANDFSYNYVCKNSTGGGVIREFNRNKPEKFILF